MNSAASAAVHLTLGYRSASSSLSHALERIREEIGQPITVISGHRCPSHNAREGGAPRNRHLFGDAADIKTRGWSGEELRQLVEDLIDEDQIPDGGMGTYRTKPRTLHYDQRGEHARWRW